MECISALRGVCLLSRVGSHFRNGGAIAQIVLRRKVTADAGGGRRHQLVPVHEIAAFSQRCMEAAGAAAPHAASLADVLVAADTSGHYSHGLNRLGKLCNEITVDVHVSHPTWYYVYIIISAFRNVCDRGGIGSV